MKDSIINLSNELTIILDDLQFETDFYLGKTEIAQQLITMRDKVTEQLRVLLDEYYCYDLRHYRNMNDAYMIKHTAQLVAKIRSTKHPEDLVTITNSMYKL